MAYDLSYFSRTYNSISRANGSSEAILSRWPFLCSRGALKKSLTDAGLYYTHYSNHQGLNLDQLTDKIIDLFDRFMYDNWFNFYTPSCFEQAVNKGYRWDQTYFWDDQSGTSFVFHDGNGAGVGIYVLDYVEIVLWPKTGYSVNSAEYKSKPFMGFDNKISKSTFAAELDLTGSVVTDLTNKLVDAGSFVIGETYNIREVGDTDWIAIGATSGTFNEQFTATGAGSGTGKARELDGTITDHQSNPITEWSGSSFMNFYNHTYYHDTLGLYGDNLSYWYGSQPSDWTYINTDTRYYSKAYALFSSTVKADGTINQFAEVLRPDGDGNNLYGGWGYNSSHHLQTLTWHRDDGNGNHVPLNEGWDGSQYVKLPQVYIDTTHDHRATDYSGNEARIEFPQPELSWFPGKNLTPGEVLYGYAIYGITGDVAYEDETQTLNSLTNYWDRSWPYWGVQPMSVRVVDERPALSATTRSLKTHTVGTGAQRYSFEFEYPPMTQDEAQSYIAAWERVKGTSETLRIGIPTKAMKHIQGVFYKASLRTASNTLKVAGGTTGSTEITVSGLKPGTRDIIPNTYFLGGANGVNKIYQVVDSTSVDEWGRQKLRVFPPLRGPIYNLNARTPEGSHGGLWFLIEARIVDDSFEYSVDAAGLYRISVRFIEAL